MRFIRLVHAVWAAALFASATVAQAQQPTPSAPGAPRPGQMQAPESTGTPQGVEVGEIHWYPVDSHCRFFTPERGAAFTAENPDTWRFAFITMIDSNPLSGNKFERGYVMANGLLRELEKGRTAPSASGNVITVWRSASEPRINVNMSLTETQDASGRAGRAGTMELFWGDKNATVEIVGDCGA